jgi:hypothetical protein
MGGGHTIVNQGIISLIIVRSYQLHKLEVYTFLIRKSENGKVVGKSENTKALHVKGKENTKYLPCFIGKHIFRVFKPSLHFSRTRSCTRPLAHYGASPSLNRRDSTIPLTSQLSVAILLCPHH